MVNVVELGEGMYELRVFGKPASTFDAAGPAYTAARVLRQVTAGLENYAPAPVVEGRAVRVGTRQKVCRTANEARLIAGLVSRFFCFNGSDSPKVRVPIGNTGQCVTFLSTAKAKAFSEALAQVQLRAGFGAITTDVVTLEDDGSGLTFGVEAAGVRLPVRLDRARAARLASWLAAAGGFQPTLEALAEHFAPAS